MNIPTIQAETAISDFMETPLSLHHSGICTLSSSLSTLTSSSPSRREAETGIWKLLPTPVQYLRRAALESGIWNLTPHPQGKSGIWNLESGICHDPLVHPWGSGFWNLESGICHDPLDHPWGSGFWNLESGNCQAGIFLLTRGLKLRNWNLETACAISNTR